MEVYGDHALAEQTCRKWFASFKDGDFDVEDKERSGEQFEALLNEDSCQTKKKTIRNIGSIHCFYLLTYYLPFLETQYLQVIKLNLFFHTTF